MDRRAWTIALLLFSIDVVSGTSFPNPCSFNCGSVDRSSPWSFYVDFETDSWKSQLALTPTSKRRGGSGSDRLKIIDEGGNKFIAITVKHGWGPDVGAKKNPTERTELETDKRTTFGKEVWYGFRVKAPVDYSVLNDRVLITQFKHRLGGKISPQIDIKQRGLSTPRIGLSICGKSGGRGSYETTHYLNGRRPLMCGKNWVAGKFNYDPTEAFRELISSTWSDIVIGTYVTNTSDGFVKIYHNRQLIYHYEGATYGWSKVAGTNARIGIYRDGNPNKGQYPPQTLHFDDFVIGSTQDEITDVLWK